MNTWVQPLNRDLHCDRSFIDYIAEGRSGVSQTVSSACVLVETRQAKVSSDRVLESIESALDIESLP